MIDRVGVALLIAVTGCSDLNPPRSDEGTLVVSSVAPDSSFAANVVALEEQGHYLFELLSTRDNSVVASDTIVAPVGYHSHHVSLEWSPVADTVTARIDHDFGEGVLKFELAIPGR